MSCVCAAHLWDRALGPGCCPCRLWDGLQEPWFLLALLLTLWPRAAWARLCFLLCEMADSISWVPSRSLLCESDSSGRMGNLPLLSPCLSPFLAFHLAVFLLQNRGSEPSHHCGSECLCEYLLSCLKPALLRIFQ